LEIILKIFENIFYLFCFFLNKNACGISAVKHFYKKNIFKKSEKFLNKIELFYPQRDKNLI